MHWLRLATAAVVASELLVRLPLLPAIRAAQDAASRSARLLRSRRISDHWKERMLPVYAGIIARNSVRFFLLLCAVVLPVALLGFGFPGGIAGWLMALMQPLNLAALVGASVLYLVVRAGLVRALAGRG